MDELGDTMFHKQRQIIGLAAAGMAAVSLAACGSSTATSGGSGGTGGAGGTGGSGGSGSSGSALSSADKVVCATASSGAWAPPVAENASDPTLKKLAEQVPAGSPISKGVTTALHKIVRYCDSHGYKAGG